ncbi:hypothetical protein ACM26V_08165 [Salipaludibacillus sp. HK11]|uniref:hypothetical protein n=1 Tax=Salipaludibacillus sp. HK11 TaxID=3394320 RepID=UPI0039FC5A46
MNNSRQTFMVTFPLVGFAIVFIASMSNNEWETSLFRAIIALPLGLFFGFLFSQVWNWIRLDLKKVNLSPEHQHDEQTTVVEEEETND